MKKPLWIAFLGVCVLAVVTGVHDFWFPATSEIKFLRGDDSRLDISLYKDGGSCGIHALLKGQKKDEVVFLDRRMNFEVTPRERKKDGLIYLGFDSMVAGRPVDLASPLGGEIERLIRFEQRRWLVWVGFFGDEYREDIYDLSAGLERTRRANQRPEANAGKSSGNTSTLVPGVAHP